MARLFIGWKNGVGGVIKIMANDTDNPLTTPNTDYGAYRFNSETAEIGYGNFTFGYTFPAQTYTYTVGDTQTNWEPNSATPKLRAEATGVSSAIWALATYYYPNNIWADKNAFHFVMEDAAAYCQRWAMYGAEYTNSNDSWIITRRGTANTVHAMEVPYKAGAAFACGTFEYLNAAPNTNTDVTASGRLANYTAASKAALGSPAWNFYQIDLPVDNAAYPTVSPAAPVAGQKIVTISPAVAKMSKRGYSVDTATEDQLIFNSNKIPMKVIKTDEVTINAGATVNVALGAAYSPGIFVDYLVQKASSANLWLPAWPDNTTEFLNVQYRITGSTLQLNNLSSVQVAVRYVVMAEDDLGVSAGTAKVFEAVGGSHVVLRRPGSAGTRLKDTILDSRLSYLPIVDQGWVPFTSFSASNLPQVGTHMYTVTWSNPGAQWKPYVLAKLARAHKTVAGRVVYQDFFAKYVTHQSYFADSSFMCLLGDTSARFYCSNGTRLEDSYTTPSLVTRNSSFNTLGLRYYIFAIPNSL